MKWRIICYLVFRVGMVIGVYNFSEIIIVFVMVFVGKVENLLINLVLRLVFFNSIFCCVIM